MATIKISEMSTTNNFENDDYTMIVQNNKNKKITRQNMLGNIENDISNNSSAIEAINTSINNIKGQILWTNPNPTSTFGEQTITLSSDDFDLYEIFYYVATSNEQIMTTKSLKGHGTRIVIPTGNFEYRTVVSNSDTSYTISSLSNNENGVPIYVIGYKTGLFDNV